MLLVYDCLVQSDSATLICTLNAEQTTGTNDNYVTYTLESFTSDNGPIKFDSVTFRNAETEVIITETTQETPKTVATLAEETVKINLPDDITTCPNFYFLEDKTQKLENCIFTGKTETTSGYCTCSFPSTTSRGEYTIYYYNGCEFISIGLTVSVTDSSLPIAIKTITFENNETCTQENIIRVYFTISSPLTERGDITEIILTDRTTDYSFSICYMINALSGTCGTDETILKYISTKGTYYVKELKGNKDTFSIYEISNAKLEFPELYFDRELQTNLQEVTHDDPTDLVFYIVLKDPTKVPTVFYGYDFDPLSCQIREGTNYLDCLFPERYDQKGEYTFNYINKCGKRDSLITVRNTLGRFDLKAFFPYQGFTCFVNPVEFSQFTIEVTKVSRGELTEATLADTEGHVISYSCESSQFHELFDCTTTETISVGTYSLATINGQDITNLKSADWVDKTIEFKIDNILSEEQEFLQFYAVDHKTLTVKLSSSSIPTPAIHLAGKDLSNCDSSNSPIILCTIEPEDLFITEWNDFSVFYLNPCNNNINSGILLRRQYTEIEATNLLITSTNTKCTFSPITQVSFTLSSAPQGELTLQYNSYTESTGCVYDADTSIVTCDISLQSEDYYYMMGIRSTYFFERIIIPEDSDFYVRIDRETDDLAQSQIKTQIIDEETPYFILYLSGEEKNKPLVYIDGERDKRVSCSRDETNLTILKCTPDEEDMPNSHLDITYTVWYIPPCKEMEKTKIKVTKKANMLPPIVVTKLSLENDKRCSTTNTDIIFITVAEHDKGTIKATITTGEDWNIRSDSCEITDKVIKCIMRANLKPQPYHLTILTTNTDKTTFDLSNVATTTIEYHPESVGLGIQIQGQVITTDLQFIVVLEDDETKTEPYIYIENNENNIVSCERTSTNQTELICKPQAIYMPDNKEYNIYYRSGCDPLTPVNLVITKNTPTIEIDSLFLNDNTKCTNTLFNTIKITTKTEISGTDFRAVIENEQGNTYLFSRCNKKDATTIVCVQRKSDTPNIESEGIYKLKFLVEYYSAEAYLIANMVTNEIKVDLISSLGDNEAYQTQEINSDNTEFTIILEDESSRVPSFYLGEDEDKEITCNRKESDKTELSCTANDELFPIGNTYTIYYKGGCQSGLATTSIQVTKTSSTVAKEIITITNISLNAAKIEHSTVTGIKNVYLTTDKQALGTISGKLKDASNVETAFTSCTVESETQIICVAPDTIDIGTYTLNDISTDDTTTKFSIGTEAQATLEYISTALGEITNEQKSQTLNASNKKLIIPYTGSEAPRVYLDQEGTKDITTYFYCLLENSNYECTEKESGLPAGTYTVYYLCECDTIITTGIEITKESIASITGITITDGTDVNDEICITAISEIQLTASPAPSEGVSSWSLTLNDGTSDMVITNCDSNVVTITCTVELTYGDYTVKSFSIDGVSYDVSSIASKVIKYTQATSEMGEQISNQIIINSNDQFKIVLADGTAPVPKLYVEDDTKDITNDCNKDSNNQALLICSLTNDYMPQGEDDTPYSIYYKSACGSSLQPANLIIKRKGTNSPIAIQISSMSLSATNTSLLCLPDQISNVYLASSSQLGGTVVLKLKDTKTNTDYTSSSCIASDSSIECSFSSLPVSTFLFVELSTDSNSYSIDIDSTVSATEIKSGAVFLGEQTETTPTITDSNKYFTIVLKSATIDGIKVYIGEDENKKLLSCKKTEGTANLVCTPTNENMPTNTNYEIYYEDGCGEIKSTGITVTRNVQTEATKITKITLASNSECTSTEFNSIEVTVESLPQKAFTIKLNDGTNDYSFSCDVQAENPMTCTSTETISSVGVFNFASVAWDDSTIQDTFDTSSLETKVKFETSPISSSQSSPQTISTDDGTFTVTLSSESSSPEIYIGEGSTTAINCTPTVTTLTCTPGSALQSGDNMVYYRGACGKVLPAGITVKKESGTSVNIKVTDITITESNICTYDALDSIIITVNNTVSSVSSAVLTSAKGDYTFQTCGVEETTITCSNPSLKLVKGVYTLKSITANGFEFDLSSIETTELKKEDKTLGAQTAEQKIQGEVTQFKVVITSSSVIPNIYIENNKVTCTADPTDTTGLTLLCDPASYIVEEGKKYEIYYDDPCDNKVKAGITVTKPKTSTSTSITVTSITLPDNSKCTTETISSIVVSLESTATDLTSVKLTSESIEYAFTSCEANSESTQFTCSNVSPSLIVGNYTVTDVQGSSNTFEFSSLTEPVIEYAATILGTQSNKQIVHADNDTFTVILSDSSYDIPEIYIGADLLTKCKKDLTTVTCEQEGHMPTLGEYTINYKNGCENVVSTGITVEKKAIDVNELTISKVIISGSEKETCSVNGINEIVITVSAQPTNEIANAVIKGEQREITFSTCSFTESTVTCNTPSSTISQGKYKLISLTSSNTAKETFSFEENANVEFSYEINPIVTQTVKSYTINESNPSFKIEISQESTITPTIFAENDNDKVDITSSCSKVQDETTQIYSLKCTPTGLEEDSTYTITYEGSCANTGSTEIEITIEKTPVPVEILSLTFLGEGDATSTKEITGLLLELNQALEQNSFEASISDSINTYTFTCSYKLEDSKHYAECSNPDKTVPVGSYKLSSITGGDKMKFDTSKVEEVELEYKEEIQPIQEPTEEEKEQIVNKNTPLQFTLASEKEETPNVYLVTEETSRLRLLEEEKIKIEGCTKDGNKVSCPVYTDTTPKGKFKVYFEGVFGDLVDTGIVVHIPIVAKNFTFGNDLQCTVGSFNEIKVSFDASIGTVSKINFSYKEGEEEKTKELPCTVIDELTLSCYDEEENSKIEISTVSTFTLSSVIDENNKNKYDLSEVKPIEVKEKVEIFGEQTETNPTITNETLTFTLILASTEIEAPKIYAGNNKEKEIECKKDTTDPTKLICTPDSESMPNNETYEIYYENICGEMESTKLSVTNKNAAGLTDPEIEIEGANSYIRMYKLLFTGILVLGL